MPPYRYLFERRRSNDRRPRGPGSPPLCWRRHPALKLCPRPRPARSRPYLVALRADAPLFNAPMTSPARRKLAATNAPLRRPRAPLPKRPHSPNEPAAVQPLRWLRKRPSPAGSLPFRSG